MINKSYKKVLNEYNKSLRFRNKLISKRPSQYLLQIKSIDPKLAECAYFLIKEREKFLLTLEPIFSEIFKEVFSVEHHLKIDLVSRFKDFSEQQIYESLQQNLPKDLEIGHTKYCIHKDDYEPIFDGFNAIEFCSLGQQKMSYLSLLFAYIELFRYKFMSYPIVLIDDVSGELDMLRWERLVTYLEKQNFQVFITTANENFKKELEKLEHANKLEVSCGRVTQYQ